MSSENTSPLLSVRPRSVLASRSLLLRGEDFGFNAWSSTEYDRDTDQLLVSLEWFHAAVPTPFVAKLRKPTVGLSANHHPMGGSRPMAFLGCARGHRIDSETRCCMQQHTKCLMSAWILSLEPEHRRNAGPPPRHENLGDSLRSVRHSSCL